MITSLNNRRVKEIRKLRYRKERDRTGLFFAEGIRIVAEAIQLNMEIDSIVFSPELLTSNFAQKLIEQITGKPNEIDKIELNAGVFKQVANKENPQGIAAIIHQRWYELEEIKDDERLWVALDGVQNPGNLGSILRTNDAVGGTGVILLDETTDPYDTASIRGSMGAVFSQKLVRTNLKNFSYWKHWREWHVVGTSGSSAVDYQDVSYSTRMILLMGSERAGLQPAHQEVSDLMIKIPMVGRSDSLNLAVATAVMLYEIFNQHRRRKEK